MRRLLTIWIALAAIVFAAHSPASADSCSRAFGRQGGTGCNSVIASGGGVTVQWSSTDKSASMNLTGSPLLTATDGSGSPWIGVRDDTAIPTGKLYYVEIVANTVQGAPNPGNGYIGLSNSSYNLTSSTSLAGSANAVGWQDSGALLISFAGCGTPFPVSAWGSNGTVAGMAIDTVHGKLWTTINGTTWNNDILANQNPATNTGGCDISGITLPLFVTYSSSAFANQVTARFASASWTLGAPSGFVAVGN